MTAAEKWNRIVELHNKHFGAKEQVVQGVWESIFAEILGYSRLDDEIERHRNIRIGSTERVITDIIIKSGGMDLFIVELKQHNLPHSDEMELQLFSYLKQLRNDLGILICDKIYIYSYDYSKDDEEQDKVVIDFFVDNQIGVKFVELFNKSTFAKTDVKEFIEFAIKVEAISNEVSKDLIYELLKKYFAAQYDSLEIDKAVERFEVEVAFSEPIKINPNPNQLPDIKSGNAVIEPVASATQKVDDSIERRIERDGSEQAEIIDEITEKCIIIKVRQWSVDRYDGDLSDAIYEATRSAWKIRMERAENADYVLSVMDGVVKAVFCDMQWRYHEERTDRLMFEGKEAPDSVKEKYIGKRIPQEYRRRGLASPCLYVNC